MIEQLRKIKEEVLEEIGKINYENRKELNELKVKVLGKSGSLTAISKGMRDVSPEERPKLGALINEVRGVIEEAISIKEKKFEENEFYT